MQVFISLKIVSTSVVISKTEFRSATTVLLTSTLFKLSANPNWTLFISTIPLASVECAQFEWVLFSISICHDTLYLTHTWTKPAHYHQCKSQLSSPRLLSLSLQTSINTFSKFILSSNPRDFLISTFFRLESEALSMSALSHNLPKFHVKCAYLLCGSRTSSEVDLISAMTLFDSVTNAAYSPRPDSKSFWNRLVYVCLGRF